MLYLAPVVKLATSKKHQDRYINILVYLIEMRLDTMFCFLTKTHTNRTKLKSLGRIAKNQLRMEAFLLTNVPYWEIYIQCFGSKND